MVRCTPNTVYTVFELSLEVWTHVWFTGCGSKMVKNTVVLYENDRKQGDVTDQVWKYETVGVPIGKVESLHHVDGLGTSSDVVRTCGVKW